MLDNFNPSFFQEEFKQILHYCTQHQSGTAENWLTKLATFDAQLKSGTVDHVLKTDIIDTASQLKQQGIDLKTLLLCRSCGLNIAAIRFALPELKLERFSVEPSDSIECPTRIYKPLSDNDIETAALMMTRQLAELIPALYANLYLHNEGERISQSLFDEDNQSSLMLERFIGRLFSTVELSGNELNRQLESGKTDLHQLADFLQGKWGDDYFAALHQAATAPENNAVRLGLMKLTTQDWQRIHKADQ
ncbi:hypothetical protein [Endozoicomonas montiporae]|nr:hypothetical protein [Endozoicomonas montiporae]